VIDLVEPPATEAGIIQQGSILIQTRLPADWKWELSLAAKGDDRIDAKATIKTPTGEDATLIFEAKQLIEGRDIPRTKARLDSVVDELNAAGPVVMARFLSRSIQEKLKAAGLSYVDLTGNMYLRTTSPALFISDRGADSDPWRGPGRPRATLKGQPAARVVRALVDFTGTWTVRELVATAETSTGSTYRVIDFLEREGLAIRDLSKQVSVIDWPQMLRRWSNDYSFAETNQVTRWLAPRGLEQFVEVVGDTELDDDYAVTGSLAAAQWAPYAPARLAMIYAANPIDAAEKWGLRPVDAGANVILAQPKFDVVFDRSARDETGVIMAAASQVVVDLMTGPGRNPNEAEQLLNWMQSNEGSWRRER